MKKVLIITTHFVPDIHVGAKRLVKFAKYLPSYGWEPIILTKEVSEYHGVDHTLLEELPSNLPIYRVREWRLSRGQKSTAPVMPDGIIHNRPVRARLYSHLLKAADFFLFYDYSWLLPAFLTARRLIRQNDIRVIYSSIPNPEAHLVALLLKLTLPVRWVCEYRDPWTKAPVTFYPLISPLQQPVEWVLEGQVLTRADRLIFVGPKNRDFVLERRSSSLAAKSVILYNGYDEDDFVGLNCNDAGNKSCFTIGHIGTFGRWITPEPFLRALGQLLRQRPELRSRVRVRFIGEVKYDPDMAAQLPQIIQGEGLHDVVALEPFLPHREALAKMIQCHCLLLMQNYLAEAPNQAPQALGAKIFEYLRSQRPILALVPPEGDAARIVREMGAGMVVAAEEKEGIVRAILEMYDAFYQGGLAVRGDLTQIQRYERRNQTKELAGILNAAVERQGKSPLSINLRNC